MTSISLGDSNVWDDSALIRSWEDALEEYKKYHSIHARGESVDEVLAEHENDTAKEASAAVDHDDAQSAAMSEDADEAGADVAPQVTGEQSHIQHAAPAEAQKPFVDPSTLLAGQDPALKNLMMSWYWTGYYSGLQAAQSASKSAG